MPDLVYLHPMIVHFPIALLTVGFAAQVIVLIWKKEWFSGMAFTLLLTGTAGVIAAYISGTYAGDGLTEAGSLKTALETHEGAALPTLIIFCLAAFLSIIVRIFHVRGSGIQWTAFVLFFLGILSLARTGYYGGELVFKHAAGVHFSVDFTPLESSEPASLPPETPDSNRTVHAD